VIACAFVDQPAATVTLVEKSPRKSDFLQAVIAAASLPATVLNIRIEEALPGHTGSGFDRVTARALAPLDKLLRYCHGWLKPSGKALLMKGSSAAAELAEARRSWTFTVSERPSLSSPEGRVLTISSIEPRRA
jgi:16S rRNA (guanine527-N7)-methyltransferase